MTQQEKRQRRAKRAAKNQKRTPQEQRKLELDAQMDYLRKLDFPSAPTKNPRELLIRELMTLGRERVLAAHDNPGASQLTFSHPDVLFRVREIGQELCFLSSKIGYIWIFSEVFEALKAFPMASRMELRKLWGLEPTKELKVDAQGRLHFWVREDLGIGAYNPRGLKRLVVER